MTTLASTVPFNFNKMRTNSSECRISTPSPLDQKRKIKTGSDFPNIFFFRAYLLHFSGTGELSTIARSIEGDSGNNFKAKVKGP
jgi:hypothetical protein